MTSLSSHMEVKPVREIVANFRIKILFLSGNYKFQKSPIFSPGFFRSQLLYFLYKHFNFPPYLKYKLHPPMGIKVRAQ